MLGFFPDPYPDELIYSSCARYAERTKYLNKQSVIRELFGKRGLSAIIDFPTRLQFLISVLPPNNNYSVKKIITKNTLLPFYAPFLPSERVTIIRAEMRGESNNKLQIRFGTKAKQIENPKYLRYCPDCVKYDRIKYGETYWHRVHQLGGICVCPDHSCFLMNSKIEIGRFSAKMFFNAEENIPKTPNQSNYISPKNRDHQILLKISKDAEWLLLSSGLKDGSKSIRDRYFNILLKRGYAYYNGRIKNNKLLDDFQDFFSDKLFELVGKVSESNKWLSTLLDKGNVNKTFHPVRHLLLMTFLGLSVKEFFTSFTEFYSFGNPPYPCLNLVSDHYKEFCIPEGKISDNLTKGEKFRRPIAVFSCKCGFTYQRLGPDKTEKDKFQYSSVREYGIIWERKFAELWADLSLSLTEIGKRVGISSTSVGRHAIRLELPMNSEGKRSLQGYDRHRNPKISFSEMKQNYKEKWLQIRISFSDLTRKELIETENFTYQWLRRNDPEWIEQNLPGIVKVSRNHELLDWEEIDKVLLTKVESVCKELKNFTDPPRRVSITEIIRRVGHKKWIEKRNQKLPLTSMIISDNLETLEEFMIRKVNVTTVFFISKKQLPSLLQFETKAVIRNLTSRNSSKVQEAIKAAMAKIKSSLSL